MTQTSFDPFDYLEQAKISLFTPASRDFLFAKLQTMSELELAHWYAKQARDAFYRDLKRSQPDLQPTRFVLKGQLEKYLSFGVEGRGYRDVYYVQTR